MKKTELFGYGYTYTEVRRGTLKACWCCMNIMETKQWKDNKRLKTSCHNTPRSLLVGLYWALYHDFYGCCFILLYISFPGKRTHRNTEENFKSRKERVASYHEITRFNCKNLYFNKLWVSQELPNTTQPARQRSFGVLRPTTPSFIQRVKSEKRSDDNIFIQPFKISVFSWCSDQGTAPVWRQRPTPTAHLPLPLPRFDQLLVNGGSHLGVLIHGAKLT